jgi:hypothetical protein
MICQSRIGENMNYCKKDITRIVDIDAIFKSNKKKNIKD